MAWSAESLSSHPVESGILVPTLVWNGVQLASEDKWVAVWYVTWQQPIKSALALQSRRVTNLLLFIIITVYIIVLKKYKEKITCLQYIE